MKLLNSKPPCICCKCIPESKWNKCLKRGKCFKEPKIKGHNVLSANSGNLSRNMRNSIRLRNSKFSRYCKCEIDTIKSRDFRCGFIDIFGNPIVEGPTITLQGDISMNYPKNTKFIEPGVKAVDHLENRLGVTRTISPNINLDVIPYAVGTYIITYSATDRFKQTTEAKRKVTFV